MSTNYGQKFDGFLVFCRPNAQKEFGLYESHQRTVKTTYIISKCLFISFKVNDLFSHHYSLQELIESGLINYYFKKYVVRITFR